jgi:hypothetical protein
MILIAGTLLWAGNEEAMLLLALGVLLLIIIKMYQPRAPQEIQPARDATTRQLLGELAMMGCSEKVFALYLRSFSIDVRRPGRRFDPLWIAGPYVDFETALFNGFWSYWPVIALDRDRRAFGAGRVIVEDGEWKSVMLQLIDQAELIFVVPGWSSGVEAEYRMIANLHAQRKLVFVMFPSTFRARRVAARQWLAATNMVSETLGVCLPSYNHRGQLIKVTADGKCGMTVTFSRWHTARALLRGAKAFLESVDTQSPKRTRRTSVPTRV